MLQILKTKKLEDSRMCNGCKYIIITQQCKWNYVGDDSMLLRQRKARKTEYPQEG